MPLARIMTSPSGLDRRSFTCTTCPSHHTTSPSADPMNADTLGWLFADLDPPN
jgi:hypothetical protein